MRLVLDARARAWLKRFPRTNLYSLAEIVLLAVLAVQCARLVWLVVTPTTPLGDWRPAAPGFAGSPSAMLRDFDPFFRLSGGDDRPGVVTSLQLTLFGTRVDEAMGGGSAIIAGPDNVQKSVAVGQEIMPGVQLKAVAFVHVTLVRGGARRVAVSAAVLRQRMRGAACRRGPTTAGRACAAGRCRGRQRQPAAHRDRIHPARR